MNRKNPSTWIVDYSPLSVLAFRDARPFQAGQSFSARSLHFPPPPAAVYWAARPLFSKLNKEDHPVIRGYAVRQGDRDLLPVPMDLHARYNSVTGEPEEWELLRPLESCPEVAFIGREVAAPFVGESREKVKPVEDGLLTSLAWRQYLLGDLNNDDHPPRAALVPNNRLVLSESRTGLELEGRKNRHGRLYTEQTLRLVRDLDPSSREVVRLRAGFHLPDTPDTLGDHLSATVRFGGEAKLAHIEAHRGDWTPAGWNGERPLADQVRTGILESASNGCARLKLCLLTPAVFSASVQVLRKWTSTPAWRPGWFPRAGKLWTPQFTDPPSYQLTLRAAMTAKPYPLGFWDTRHRADDAEYQDEVGNRESAGTGTPKPLYRCLPAGAVWFLELGANNGASLEEALLELFDHFWLKTVCVRKNQSETWFGRMGFGLTAIGVSNYAK